MSVEKQVAAALGRLAQLSHQELLTTRENALRFGPAAQPLLEAIDERLEAFQQEGGMAVHRLEFARSMLRLVERGSPGWIPARDIFLRAQTEFADNPFVIWMKGNTARQIPVTKALDDVLPEFPHIERRKDGVGQGDRVYFRRKPG